MSYYAELVAARATLTDRLRCWLFGHIAFTDWCHRCGAEGIQRTAPVRAGHCGHVPKCTGAGPTDERDPLGCCNCGTREAEARRGRAVAAEGESKRLREELATEQRVNLAALKALLPELEKGVGQLPALFG